jgi:hypothetical protein
MTDRASCTIGVFVKTLAPGKAGIALENHSCCRQGTKTSTATYQEATGFGDRSTSTRHILEHVEGIDIASQCSHELILTDNYQLWQVYEEIEIKLHSYPTQDGTPVMVTKSAKYLKSNPYQENIS